MFILFFIQNSKQIQIYPTYIRKKIQALINNQSINPTKEMKKQSLDSRFRVESHYYHHHNFCSLFLTTHKCCLLSKLEDETRWFMGFVK